LGARGRAACNRLPPPPQGWMGLLPVATRSAAPGLLRPLSHASIERLFSLAAPLSALTPPPATYTRDVDSPALGRAACRGMCARSIARCADPDRRRRNSPPAPATG